MLCEIAPSDERRVIELSVLAPCLNEQDNLPELASRVLDVFVTGNVEGELVLVDDGSTDRTAAVIRELIAKYPDRVVGIFHQENRGIAAAWVSAASHARGEYVATIDADLQYQPEDILRLRRELHAHAVDVVQGWRSPVGRRRDSRYHVSRGLNFMLNQAFGMHMQDNKSGFVLCKREIMLDLLSHRASYFYWQSFIMVAAKAKGYSFREVETLFERRKQGTSFLEGANTFKASAKSIVDVGKAVWEYRITEPPPDVTSHFLRKHAVLDRSPERDPASRVRWRAYMATFDKSHWMVTRDVEHYYETLRKTQWLDAARTRELQSLKLQRLLRHAYAHVPYYRARMQEAGVSPADIRDISDLHKLPMLTKADVRKHLYFDIMSDNHDKSQVLKISTSGSTGEPFTCFADRAQLEFRWAATLRAQEWTGYKFGDPCVRLWHQTLGMTRAQVAREKLDSVFCNRTFVPVFEMSAERLNQMVRTVADANPVLLDGYAEALDLFARWMKTNGTVNVRPQAIMSSAQTLPAASRALIEEAFGCKVFDKYGSREFSGIAYECEAHAGHHVVAEGYIVEVLRGDVPARPGETGEVVVTDLNNFCMPFIRYRIGDLAEAMEETRCQCGRGAPRIGNIQGRVQSIIQGTEGRYLPGTFFAHYLKEFDHAIQCFQIMQDEPEAIRFQIVKAGRYSDSVLDEILTTMREYLGERMRIDVEFVASVALVRTGKRLGSVSTLPVDFSRLSAAPPPPPVPSVRAVHIN